MTSAPDAAFEAHQERDQSLRLSFRGRWTSASKRPPTENVLAAIKSGANASHAVIDAKDLAEWDTTFVAALVRITADLASRKIDWRAHALPEGIENLLKLAGAAPPVQKSDASAHPSNMLARFGEFSLTLWKNTLAMLAFFGETTATAVRFSRGITRVRWADVFAIIEDCGPRALPIVALISFLVGLILAYVGAVQLRQFGAQIYVANLVGIAMLREMGAVMAGVIMAGRTGAAFAAQLGTMQVNEEIDALSTFGFSPHDYLVLPRMLALILMMPILCVFADLFGILGGAAVSKLTFDLSLVQYVHQTQQAATLSDFWVGITKSVVFGVIVAVCGCVRGIRCGRSAQAVGVCVTSAVVTGIVWIVVSDAAFAVICDILEV